MKSPIEKPRRHHAVTAARNPAKARQEDDFTAEGSPPPGKVGTQRPTLPEAKRARPAVADKGDKR